MVARVMAMVAGLAGGAGLSQFPEFSQQYMQRLGGAVDELGRQVVRYEADAAAVDMSLPQMIAALAQEGPLSQTQADNMERDVARYGRLRDALTALEGAGPFMRARLATHMSDRDIAERAFEAYKPAVPATFEGAVFAGTGFFAGWAGWSLVFGFLAMLGRSFIGMFRSEADA